jgi:hypothetical protein
VPHGASRSIRALWLTLVWVVRLSSTERRSTQLLHASELPQPLGPRRALTHLRASPGSRVTAWASSCCSEKRSAAWLACWMRSSLS